MSSSNNLPQLLVFPEPQDAPSPMPKASWSAGDGITMIAMTLMAIGIVMIYSSSSIGMEVRAADATRFLRKQLLWAFLAACVFIIARTTDTDMLKKYAWPIYGATAFLLLLVLIPGLTRDVNGAKRWIRVAGMNLQPSEIGKLAVIIITAKLLSLHKDRLGDFKGGFIPIILPVIGMALLIVVEPDFGSTLLIVTVAMSMIFVAGARFKHLALLSVPGFIGLVGLVLLKGAHVRRRLAAFFDPNADPKEVGYQVYQAIIAIGSGGWVGAGLGAGRQKRMFLPEVHTDFIFALIGEELGFVGSITVISLYVLLIFAGLRAILKARDSFDFFLGFGITLLIGLQTLINMAVATGSVPPKGIALPMISFGGSSLLLCAASLGILVNIASRGERIERIRLMKEMQKQEN